MMPVHTGWTSTCFCTDALFLVLFWSTSLIFYFAVKLGAAVIATVWVLSCKVWIASSTSSTSSASSTSRRFFPSSLSPRPDSNLSSSRLRSRPPSWGKKCGFDETQFLGIIPNSLTLLPEAWALVPHIYWKLAGKIELLKLRSVLELFLVIAW